MSRAKHVERISHELNMSGKSLDTIIPEECDKIAAILYDAGCRMQSEGEWVMSEWGDDAACSECGCAPYDFKEPLQNPEIAQYCPGCGAKMRGVNFGKLKTWDEIRKEREMVG